MTVIADTTVLSNFAAIGALGMLPRLFARLYIAAEVYQEIALGMEEGYDFCHAVIQSVHPLSPRGWIVLTAMSGEEELRLFAQMPGALHSGEGASLAIAKHRGWTLLTDDRAARRQAVRLGTRLSGSVGCLLRAVELALCTMDEANEYLSRLIKLGFRSPTTDLATLL